MHARSGCTRHGSGGLRLFLGRGSIEAGSLNAVLCTENRHSCFNLNVIFQNFSGA